MFKRYSIAVVMGACLLLVLTACQGGSGRAIATPTPLPALVSYEKAIFKVERGPIVSEKDLTANIMPSKQDELFFRATGYVTRVAVKAGDLVKQGDLLAEQQIDDLLNQLEQAKIDLEVAQATLAKDQAEWKFAADKAQIDVNIWQKKVELAKVDVENAIGTADKEKAQLNLDIAEQNLALAQINLQQSQQEANPYEQQAVERSSLAVQRLEGLIAERQILAPYDGIVLKSSLIAGQQISAYTIAFNFGDPTGLVLRTPFDSDLNETLTPSSEVRLYLTQDDPVPHPVQFMPNFTPISASDKSNTGISTDYLYFSVPTDGSQSELNVNRTVRLTVVLGRKDSVLLLPPAAIRSYRGAYFVIVLDGDRRRRVEVGEIGLKTSERWEVVADLQEGDQVLGP